MSLPPERISIKRRRQDDPVDRLILDPGSIHDQKRRFTDFYFQRLHCDNSRNTSYTRPSSSTQPPYDYSSFGIPTVKSTAPGDEVRDFARYKAAHSEETVKPELTKGTSRSSSLLHKDSDAPSHPQQMKSARRFHLTRDLSSIPKSDASGISRRPKASLRPPLATFIEHRDAQHGGEASIHKGPPVDSLIELKTQTSIDESAQPLDSDSISKKIQVTTFVRPPQPTLKHGKSIRDDPTTWDHNSDQLANELAALAFDIDPADATEPPVVVPAADVTTAAVPQSNKQISEPMIVDTDDDFVFETYVRVKHESDAEHLTSHHNNEIGILVIDDVNEDLWEKYVQSDDDEDEWDDEDEDSNAEDNPRNEYPEDEVSTDDEFGRNVYKYRRNASDDEEYDQGQHTW